MRVVFGGGGAARGDGTTICGGAGEPLRLCDEGVELRHLDRRVVDGLLNSVIQSLYDELTSVIPDPSFFLYDFNAEPVGWLMMLTNEAITYTVESSVDVDEYTIVLPGVEKRLGKPLSETYAVLHDYTAPKQWRDDVIGAIWVRMPFKSGVTRVIVVHDPLNAQLYGDKPEDVFPTYVRLTDAQRYVELNPSCGFCAIEGRACICKSGWYHPNGCAWSIGKHGRGIAVGFHVKHVTPGLDCERVGVEEDYRTAHAYGAAWCYNLGTVGVERGDGLSATQWRGLKSAFIPPPGLQWKVLEVRVGKTTVSACMYYSDVHVCTQPVDDTTYSTFNYAYMKGGISYGGIDFYVREYVEGGPEVTSIEGGAYAPPVYVGSFSEAAIGVVGDVDEVYVNGEKVEPGEKFTPKGESISVLFVGGRPLAWMILFK